jgi:uncharacterized protein (TIGR00290 family)
MLNVAVSWTGGKDSSLALYEAEKLGCKICCLVTFDPGQGSLIAHPFDFIRLQAKALCLPHYLLKVDDPFDRSYEDAIASLREQQGIDTLVTGDIGEVAGHDPNWIVERSVHCGVDVIRPLWHRERLELLEKLLTLRFKVVFSCVKSPWFTDEWLGLELSPDLVERLRETSERTGLDICGEQGEYHTLVVDGPQFRKRIQIESYSKRVEGSVMYIALETLKLCEKDA